MRVESRRLAEDWGLSGSPMTVFGRTSRPVVGDKPGPGAKCRIDGRCPAFGQQHLSVVLRQVHHIADATI